MGIFRLMPFFRLVSVMCFVATMSAATETPQRFTVNQDELVFNGDVASADPTVFDEKALGAVLRDNPNIQVVVLTGDFPVFIDAFSAAKQIEEFDVATSVRGRCSRCCIYMFVAGRTRKVLEGGYFALQRTSIDAETVKKKFTELKDSYGWLDEYQESAWLYRRAEIHMQTALQYLIGKGIDPRFALQIFETKRDVYWQPTTEQLIAANVIER